VGLQDWVVVFGIGLQRLGIKICFIFGRGLLRRVIVFLKESNESLNEYLEHGRSKHNVV